MSIELRRQTERIIRNFIDGLNLTYLSASSVTVSAGMCSNLENSDYIVSNSTLTVSIPSIAANTTYHIYVQNISGTVQAYSSGSTSISGARRVGSVVTDGSANIRNFVQTGDMFCLNVPYLSISQAQSTVVTNAGNPSGIRTEVFGQVGGAQSADNSAIGASVAECPDTTGAAISFGGGNLPFAQYGFGGGRIAGQAGHTTFHSSFVSVLTNASGQIRLKGNNGNTTMSFFIVGWRDSRGKE
jgi:hypothetical protein